MGTKGVRGVRVEVVGNRKPSITSLGKVERAGSKGEQEGSKGSERGARGSKRGVRGEQGGELCLK